MIIKRSGALFRVWKNLLRLTLLAPLMPALAATTRTAPVNPFKIFNSLNFQHVDLSAYGIPRLMTSPAIQYRDGKPDLESARYWARSAAGIAMDNRHRPVSSANGKTRIEHPPENLVLDQEGGVTADHPDDLANVVAAIRDEWAKYPDHPEFKNLKLGIYANVPPAPPDDMSDPAKMDDWDARTDKLVGVARRFDFISPVCYTGITDVSDFAASMSPLIREARRYHKPVYVFIWPEYFELNQNVPVHELIGRDMWQAIFDEARNEADGVILWGGEHRYDSQQPWARITKGALAEPVKPAPAEVSRFKVDPAGLHLKWAIADSTARVRVERSVDNGKHWLAIGITEPGENHFDDSDYRPGMRPTYRAAAFNAFGTSDYVTSDVITPARDAFAVNHAYYCDARHPATTTLGPRIHSIFPGRWVEFSNVSFSRDADHFIALSDNPGVTLEVWLDCTVNADNSLSGGVKVGSMLARKAAGDAPFAWIEQSCPVNIAGGPGVKHNVFITASGPGCVNLDWIRFGDANAPSAPPRHLSASSQGGSVQLNWIDASDDETGFRVERSDDEGWTWTSFVKVPPNLASAADLVAYVDHPPTHSRYTYRVSSLHGSGKATQVITDVASSAPSTRPAGIPFNADTYDRQIGLNESYPGELYHTEQGISTHPGQTEKGPWVKYSAVDFGEGSDRITIDAAPIGYLDSSKTISFYIDRLDPDHTIGRFTPIWNGGWPYYDTETLAIKCVSGVHDLYMQFDEPTVKTSIRTIRVDKVSPVPQILSSTVVGTDHVELKWQQDSPVNGMFVQWRKALQKPANAPRDWPTPRQFIRWTGAAVKVSDRQYDVKKLEPNTQYEFRVVARTPDGPRPSVMVHQRTGS